MQMLRRFIKDAAGATAMEYGLIVLLIGVAVIAGVTNAGTSLSGSFNNISGKLP